jgi:hypothetical protein
MGTSLEEFLRLPRLAVITRQEIVTRWKKDTEEYLLGETQCSVSEE